MQLKISWTVANAPAAKTADDKHEAFLADTELRAFPSIPLRLSVTNLCHVFDTGLIVDHS